MRCRAVRYCAVLCRAACFAVLILTLTFFFILLNTSAVSSIKLGSILIFTSYLIHRLLVFFIKIVCILLTSHLNTASFHYLRNGLAFLYFFVQFLFSCIKYHRTRSQLSSAWFISSAQQRIAALAQKRSAVRCRALPCGTVRSCIVLCRAACLAVLTLSYNARHLSKYHLIFILFLHTSIFQLLGKPWTRATIEGAPTFFLRFLNLGA